MTRRILIGAAIVLLSPMIAVVVFTVVVAAGVGVLIGTHDVAISDSSIKVERR